MRHRTSCYSMTSVARLKTGEGPVQLAKFDDSVPCLVGFKLDNNWDFMAILPVVPHKAVAEVSKIGNL